MRSENILIVRALQHIGEEAAALVAINLENVAEFGPAQNNVTGEEIGTWFRYIGADDDHLRFCTMLFADVLEQVLGTPIPETMLPVVQYAEKESPA